MERKKYVYSSGEFAALNGINKRTLHYYNDIGLFRPAYQGENGYHYYTCFQFAHLELILTLRRLGMSLEEIRRLTEQPSPTTFAQMAAERKEVIDRSIAQLLQAKAFLQQKLDKLTLAMTIPPGEIQHITLPERPILLSEAITGRYDDEDFAVAASFSLRLRQRFGLFDSFGSRVSVSVARQGGGTGYGHFFAYAPAEEPDPDTHQPAGTYLRTVVVGSWEDLFQTYDHLLDYARQQHLVLTPFAYEEGLNELTLTSQEDYRTMITVGCQPAEGSV